MTQSNPNIAASAKIRNKFLAKDNTNLNEKRRPLIEIHTYVSSMLLEFELNPPRFSGEMC